MGKPFDQLSFKYPWRDYQHRVLDELSSHLNDDHLHVVAAPGAGKTILGLEVMRRLNEPSLIIAPTITIRDQWVDRLCTLFLEECAVLPEWISKSLREPSYLTVVTYQAVHAAFTGTVNTESVDEECDDNGITLGSGQEVSVIQNLKKQGVRTMVLDEAHHLRHEWWKHLTTLKRDLEPLKVVSLTATPPYDVIDREWQRYEALCGSIDAEISVPELVKSNNLCPHQDYVYFSEPTRDEMQVFAQYNTGVSDFLAELERSETFSQLLESHPWIIEPILHEEAILQEPQFFSAMLIALNSMKVAVPDHAFELLGVSEEEIPHLDRDWFELLLNHILFLNADYFQHEEVQLKAWKSQLRKIGAIERRRVKISDTKTIRKLLANSLAKLDSIVDIVEAESANMGVELRLVILADYIRADQMPSDSSDERVMEKLGVVPIFEFIRNREFDSVSLGVLTGSLVVLPVSAVELLKTLYMMGGGDSADVKTKPLRHDSRYVEIEIRGGNRSLIVSLMTQLFTDGAITVLVGTQALLGEGWDAPSLNTLIIASNVGSYMLSNQMRGRAIRVDPNQPNKIANVWHLVGVDTYAQSHPALLDEGKFNELEQSHIDAPLGDLGHDFEQMERRFRAFEGVSYDEPYVIENGFSRLNLSAVEWTSVGVEQINQKTLNRAVKREQLKGSWNVALVGNSSRPQLHERVETEHVPGVFVFRNTLKYLMINAAIGGMSIFFYFLEQIHPSAPTRQKLTIVLIGLVVALCYSLPKLLRALYLWFRNGTVEKQIKQVGLCVVDALRFVGLINTPREALLVVSGERGNGVVYAQIEGVTKEEERSFNQAMETLLNPVDNPRYLLVREKQSIGVSAKDYHAIPDVIAAKKESALKFAEYWRKHVGAAYCVYTRNGDGRRALLKARVSSLSASFQQKAERKCVWE